MTLRSGPTHTLGAIVCSQTHTGLVRYAEELISNPGNTKEWAPLLAGIRNICKDDTEELKSYCRFLSPTYGKLQK